MEIQEICVEYYGSTIQFVYQSSSITFSPFQLELIKTAGDRTYLTYKIFCSKNCDPEFVEYLFSHIDQFPAVKLSKTNKKWMFDWEPIIWDKEFKYLIPALEKTPYHMCSLEYIDDPIKYIVCMYPVDFGLDHRTMPEERFA